MSGKTPAHKRVMNTNGSVTATAVELAEIDDALKAMGFVDETDFTAGVILPSGGAPIMLPEDNI